MPKHIVLILYSFLISIFLCISVISHIFIPSSQIFWISTFLSVLLLVPIIFIPILIIDLIVYRKLNYSDDTNYFYYAGFFLAIFLFILGFILTFIIHPYYIFIVISITMGPFVVYVFKSMFNKIRYSMESRKVKKDQEKWEIINKKKELKTKSQIIENLIQEKDFPNAIIELNNFLEEAKKYELSKRSKWAFGKLEEIEAKKFVNLMRQSKDLSEKGMHKDSEKQYMAAVDHWKDAINNYELALEKVPAPKEKAMIEKKQRILKENICNAYIKSGKKHNNTAKIAHKEEDIEKAENEWNSAIKDYKSAIDLIKLEKFSISIKQLESNVDSIKLNLKQLELEKSCLSMDKKVEEAQDKQKEGDLYSAREIIQETTKQYSEIESRANDFQILLKRVQIKKVKAGNVQSKILAEIAEIEGFIPSKTKVIIDDSDDIKKEGTIIKPVSLEKALSIKREYEFIGGQVRFKVGLINNTGNPLTSFKISFDLPKALKWIIHEPKYERKGDSILIPKLGINEKKAVSLYLEPINCMNSPINATVSFFDVKDRPQAVPMEPKMISITCPIFFTREEANLARVKRLQRTLSHRDRKILPIINLEKSSLIFSSVLSVLGEHDIKLIYKEYSKKEQFGEAWYYGLTKVKKNQHVVYILFDGKSKTLEIEVAADDEGQITAFLAEIGNGIRKQLIKQHIISSEDRFYDIKISVLSSECPYCMSQIPAGLVQKYLDGTPIKCKYCDCKILISKDSK